MIWTKLFLVFLNTLSDWLLFILTILAPVFKTWLEILLYQQLCYENSIRSFYCKYVHSGIPIMVKAEFIIIKTLG